MARVERQIYAMPVFDMLETFLVKKLRFKPGWPLRLIARSLYVGMSKHLPTYRLVTEILKKCTEDLL